MIEPIENDVAELLRKVGARAAPKPEVAAAVYQAALTAWRREVRRRRMTRISLALAASVVLSVVGAWVLQPHADNLVAIVSGSTERTLHVGERLASGENELRLARSDGVIMRLAVHSVLVAASKSDVRLESGHLYVETGDTATHETQFRLLTPFATIDHLGTQFVAALDDAGMQIAVRQGQLAVHTPQVANLIVAAHEATQVNSNGQSVRLLDQKADDLWQWVDKDTLIAIEGRTLYAVLAELSQRDGLALRFSKADISDRAHDYVLHGPSLTLTPRRAIDIVTASAGVRAQVADQVLTIQPL